VQPVFICTLHYTGRVPGAVVNKGASTVQYMRTFTLGKVFFSRTSSTGPGLYQVQYPPWMPPPPESVKRWGCGSNTPSSWYSRVLVSQEFVLPVAHTWERVDYVHTSRSITDELSESCKTNIVQVVLLFGIFTLRGTGTSWYHAPTTFNWVPVPVPGTCTVEYTHVLLCDSTRYKYVYHTPQEEQGETSTC
jgi:hypothetical protein